MTEAQIIKLQNESYAAGQRFGFELATAIVQGCQFALSIAETTMNVPPDQIAARRDQLEIVLAALSKQEMELL